MVKKPSESAATLRHYDAVIIGSGFSGLCAGILLKQSGRHNFVIYDKAKDIGGTWFDNHYPGAACDVPSHMYSFSFEPNPNWSRMYSEQAEIWRYMKHCERKYGLEQHVHCNHEVKEIRWIAERYHYLVTLASGEQVTARIVVSGIGGLSRPALPKVKGLESFKGVLFHSASWNHDVDLSDKRVGVIGTGASAIQFIPQLQKTAKQVVVFQRTPAWIIPKPDWPIPYLVQNMFAKLPKTQKLARNTIYWLSESFGAGFIHPDFMAPVKRLAQAHLSMQVKDVSLREKLTPNYTIGCKRVLFSNNFYPALTQPNVTLIAEGVREITPEGIVDANGQLHTVDVIVCGTGFDTQDPIGPLNIIDAEGHNIKERGYLSAYKGITKASLPNFFFLLGPNTGLGHNSIVFMIEAQARYMLQCIEEMDKRGAKMIQVKSRAEQAYNKVLQKQLQTTVWNTGGCKSWYLNEDGVNTTVWPSFTWRYWLETRNPTFKNFDFV